MSRTETGPGGSSEAGKGCEDIHCDACAALLDLYEFEAYVRILMYLASTGTFCSIRKLSKNTGIGHKALVKKLEDLVRVGLVEMAYENSNLRLYKPTRRALALASLARETPRLGGLGAE